MASDVKASASAPATIKADSARDGARIGRDGSRLYLRECRASDMPAIQSIYAYNVRNGYATC